MADEIFETKRDLTILHVFDYNYKIKILCKTLR